MSVTDSVTGVAGRPEPERADETWWRCERCGFLVYRKRLIRLLYVCPECGGHVRLGAAERIGQLVDTGSAVPIAVGPTMRDPLGFRDRMRYEERLARAHAGTGLADAALAVSGTIMGRPVVMVVMDFRFLGGSLGAAAGEAVTAAAELAADRRHPLVLVTASGGARMQEGPLALMQMAKTSNALAALNEAGVPTVAVITDPTYGGVAASFATLCDVIIAEPGARMGFAGARVVEQTIGERLPPGFQTAEFLVEHGLIDAVVPRCELRGELIKLLRVADTPPAAWGEDEAGNDGCVVTDPAALVGRDIEGLTALTRDLGRPTSLDHIGYWLDGFVELRGDRAGSDCPAIIGGIGHLDGLPLMVIGHQKGHSTAEMLSRRFGMASPAGYRKSARLMSLAARLRLPVVTLVDTPGAYPGKQAEETGQAVAIAEAIRLMGSLPVPVVTVITGEGGSGGALALAVADRVLICENATYSVISPEGCAAILWKTSDAAPEAARALRIDASSLLRLGVVDGVVPEPPGGAHTAPSEASGNLRRALIATLRELRGREPERLVRDRRRRFRGFGQELAAGTAAPACGHRSPA